MKVIKEIEGTDIEGRKEYRAKKTDETRVRRVFTFLPLWLNRFSWFQKVDILERKYVVQWLEFSEFSYKFYWSEPQEEWYKEKIL